MSKLGDLIDRVMDLYDGLMQKALGIGWLRAYYSDPMVFVRHVAQKYMSGTTLTAEQEEQVAAEGFVPLLGKEEVQRIAKKLTRKHAWHVGIMTFLCSLPQNWVMWPLFVVDIVYFQKEVFLLTQEMEILFGKTRTKRDYTSLAAVAVKMGGTQMKQKAVGWVKRGAGKGMRMALEYGSKVYSAARCKCSCVRLLNGLVWLERATLLMLPLIWLYTSAHLSLLAWYPIGSLYPWAIGCFET